MLLHALPFLLQALSQGDDAALRVFVDEGRGDAQAIGARLRSELGPRGAVDAVNAVFVKDATVSTFAASPRLERLRSLIDAAAAQKDGWASGLAWHTDLDAARKEARDSGKPILSLRLLGRLDDDLSCANSRFFRTLLYVDPAVQKEVSGFVLHWQTVRAAPKITIDMGDGRVLTTTITGNSAHLILDADGNVVDAIPGLLSPAAFQAMLASAKQVAQVAKADRPAMHSSLRDPELRGWRALAPPAGLLGDAKAVPLVGKSAKAPRAVEAGNRAMAKSVPEMPVVRAIAPVDAAEVRADPFFDAAAVRSRGAVVFSENAKRLVARKLSGDQKLQPVLDRLQLAVAKDTIINRFVFHDAVRSWLADGVSDPMVVQNRLYDELFLTPKADPWLGLVDENAYTGVDGGGVGISEQQKR